MSLLLADGFDGYASRDDLPYPKDAQGIYVGAGRNGGRALVFSYGLDHIDVSVLNDDGTNRESVGFGIYWKWTGTQFPNGGDILRTYQSVTLGGSENERLRVDIMSNGQLRVSESGVQIGQTGARLFPGRWHQIEFFHDGLAGGCTLRIDGDTVGTFAAGAYVTAQGAGFSKVRLEHPSGGIASGQVYWDDMYALTNDGAGLTSFLGGLGVLQALARADAASAFTPKIGTHPYAMIDEAAADDSDWNESNVNGAEDRFRHATDLSGYQILALSSVVRAETTEPGNRRIIPALRSAGVGADGSGHTLAQDAPLVCQDASDTDPATGAAWLPAAANAAEFGYKNGAP